MWQDHHLLAGCAKPTTPTEAPAPPPAEEGLELADTLYVFNWADYIDESLVTDYEEEFGVTVDPGNVYTDEAHLMEARDLLLAAKPCWKTRPSIPMRRAWGVWSGSILSPPRRWLSGTESGPSSRRNSGTLIGPAIVVCGLLLQTPWGASLFIYILHHLVGYTLFHFLGWHDQFGFPAVALMLLASFIVIYVILRALPGPVRVVHRVLS